MATTRSVVEIELAMKGAAAARTALEGLGAGATATATRVTQATMAVQRLNTATVTAGQQAKLTSHQITNLGFQLNDIATGLASGQSPFRILAQQGGQVYQALSMGPGGVLGALSAIKNMLPSILPRLGLVGALGAGAWAGFRYIQKGMAEDEENQSKARLTDFNVKSASMLQREIDQQEKRGLLTPDRAAGLRATVTDAAPTAAANYIDEIQRRLKEPGPNGGPMGSGVSNEEINRMNRMRRGVYADAPGTADILRGVTKELYENLNILNDAQQKATYKANEAKAKADDDYRRAKLSGDEYANEQAFKSEEISLEQFIQRKKELAIEGNSITLDALTRQEEQLNQDLLDSYKEKDKEKAKTQQIALEGELAANKMARLTVEEEEKAALLKIEQEYNDEVIKIDQRTSEEVAREQEEAARNQLKADREHKQALEDELRLRQQLFDLQMNTIGSDYGRTSADKYDEQMRLINEAMEAGTIDRAQGQLMQNQLGPDPSSFLDQLHAKIIQVRDAWGTMQQQMATGVVNLVTDSVSGLSGALTSVIMGTKSAGAAFAQFGLSLLTNFISMILQAILWATVAIPILTALGILSGGSTVGPGLGVTLGALAAGSAAASGVTGGRALGGSVIGGMPYIVGERRPELFVPETSGRIIPQVDGAAMGGGGGGAGGGRGNGTVVYVVSNHDEALKDAAQRNILNPLIVNAVRQNRTRLGMKG